MKKEFTKGQIVYTLDIDYNEGLIRFYFIGAYKVESIEKYDNGTCLYIIKNVEKNIEDDYDKEWRGRKLEYELFGSKKEIYEYVLQEYEIDLNKIRNWFKHKEEFFIHQIKEIKKHLNNKEGETNND